MAASAYAVLAISTAMFGLAAHATHFGAFFVTAGLCLLWLAWQKEKWLPPAAAAAFIFGTAILMKQHAVFIACWAALAFAALSLHQKGYSPVRRIAALGVLGVAMILPFALCCLLLWRAGVFGKFWFWTMAYGKEYVFIIRLSDLFLNLGWSLHSIFTDCCLWWFSVAGLAAVWVDERLRKIRLWLLGFALASALTTAPGFYFRTHYFLLALPAAALLAGCAVSGAANLLRQKAGAERFCHAPAGLFVLLLALILVRDGDVVAVLNRVGSHALYGGEPFPEAAAAAAFIRASSPPAARIAVLGSEPEIYFLARRHSATGYIYVYALMEPQPFARRMQAEMIREIETNNPEFVIYANVGSSWLQQAKSDTTIFNWWTAYQTNYDRVGIAEIVSLVETRYFWDVDAGQFGRLKNSGLEIYRRKTLLPVPAATH